MDGRRRTYVILAALVVMAAGGGLGWGLAASGPPLRTGSEPETTRAPVPVIVPGRPGESASVVPSDQLPAPDGSRYHPSDVLFVRRMIPHHRQAVEMAALAPSRAGDPRLRAIADRILVAQGPEIAVLQAWLGQRGLDERASEHDHGTERGMASPAAIRALTDATGAAFDRMFVDLMSAHHQGAIDMCREVLTTGVDERIQELATNIAAEQQVEIARMRAVLGP
jgi:uncharacterized protein (DUF305 family)